ncbi:hypothetical protein B7463_g11739, partial [Scytalidium lignicola]
MPIWSYSGHNYWSYNPASVSEGEREIAEAILKIRSLYDAGFPYFTKEALRNAYQQLMKAREDRTKVTLIGLDRAAVDFDIEVGRIFEGDEPELEFIVGEPFIFYLPFVMLTSEIHNLIPRLAYCNLQIFHYMTLRNKTTKEILGRPIRPYVEVKQFFKTSQQTWEASEYYKQLSSTLASAELPLIKKIIAFACGPMAYVDESNNQLTLHSTYRHLLILILKDLLNKKMRLLEEITCYAQDPDYTEVDKSVLRESGVTVLDEPKAFLEVDDSTTMISFAANVPVKEIVLDIARPALMIWDSICIETIIEGQDVE